jgi:hypothetical protein
MQSTLNPNQVEPRDIRLDTSDAARVARAAGEAPSLAPEAVRHALDAHARAASSDGAGAAVPPVDTTFRPAVDNVRIAGDRGAMGKRVLRGVAGFVFTVCVGVAVVAFQESPYGDVAKQTIRQTAARWVPQFVPASWLSSDPEVAAEPNASTDQAAATNAAPPQQTASAQATADAGAPTAAGLSPDLTQLLQSMAHDLATVEQGIEQLKASQDQLARDNAKAVEQLRASQEQMARLIAKATAEQNRARLAALPPRPAAVNPTAFPARRPVSALPPPQTIAPPPVSAPPPAATQPPAEDAQVSSAPRPPMPVH